MKTRPSDRSNTLVSSRPPRCRFEIEATSNAAPELAQSGERRRSLSRLRFVPVIDVVRRRPTWMNMWSPRGRDRTGDVSHPWIRRPSDARDGVRTPQCAAYSRPCPVSPLMSSSTNPPASEYRVVRSRTWPVSCAGFLVLIMPLHEPVERFGGRDVPGEGLRRSWGSRQSLAGEPRRRAPASMPARARPRCLATAPAGRRCGASVHGGSLRGCPERQGVGKNAGVFLRGASKGIPALWPRLGATRSLSRIPGLGMGWWPHSPGPHHNSSRGWQLNPRAST